MPHLGAPLDEDTMEDPSIMFDITPGEEDPEMPAEEIEKTLEELEELAELSELEAEVED
jgi:hypothetical protein